MTGGLVGNGQGGGPASGGRENTLTFQVRLHDSNQVTAYSEGREEDQILTRMQDAR